MRLFNQLKLNAILAIVFGILTILGETIRRYGEWGHWSWWMDDYFMGTFLIVSAIFILKGNIKAVPFLIAAWGFNAGLLYGSFFSKVTDTGYHFQSNIEPSLLIKLIGLAFFTAMMAMIWLLFITIKRT